MSHKEFLADVTDEERNPEERDIYQSKDGRPRECQPDIEEPVSDNGVGRDRHESKQEEVVRERLEMKICRHKMQ